ncbi:MAG TPA: M28 family peptidase [Candidatus Rifleibacterium sp.]|nr:M28 family peptidase [Candidatus Rifleibacterium sp.]HPT44832.1 M28 family peptidase [Candidatus Rifleibacterium sp.]
MEKASVDFLLKMLSTPSPSGSESRLQRVWLDHVKKFAQVYTDHAGNAIGILNPEAPFKILLAGHSDEIGMIVNRIDEKGFVYFNQAGGINPYLLPGLKVEILGFKGTSIKGVIGFTRKLNSEGSGKPKCEDYFIDCGFSDSEELKKHIRVGDYILYRSDPEILNGNRIVCKGLDNKTGSFMVAEILKKLSRKKLKVGVFGASTTGEETNMRGAHCAGAMIKPNMAIAIDVTFNTDTPGEDSKRAEVLLDSGPALSIGSPINIKINELIEKAAKKMKMPYQLELTPARTSTDADKIMFSGDGVPVSLVSLPLRYMHSPVEMGSLHDMDQIIDLLVETIASLTGKEDLRPVLP